MPECKRYFSLAGVVLMLALCSLALWLAGFVNPAPGLAAPAGIAAPDPSRAITATVFLPVIGRPEVIVPNQWLGEYFANATVSGDPAFTRDEVRIEYDWDRGAPAGLPVDGFSVRWSGYWGFEAGTYTFFISADDGVRLWLDGVLLLDSWTVGAADRQTTVQVNTEGQHKVAAVFRRVRASQGVSPLAPHRPLSSVARRISIESRGSKTAGYEQH